MTSEEPIRDILYRIEKLLLKLTKKEWTGPPPIPSFEGED
jgi:hypothetical protein